MFLQEARIEDMDFCMSIDRHITRKVLGEKIESKEYYLITNYGRACGVLRYGLFWDNTPFLNLIYLLDCYRNSGIGGKALLEWEDRMKKDGYDMVLTSTQANERAQFFYRRNGYRECGCLILDDSPMEMFFKKDFL